MTAQPNLARTMGAVGALLITLSGLSPSIGVFVVGADVIHAAGSAAFLCFVTAGLLGVAIANVYAELAAAVPETGGEYTIVGRVLGPGWGFAMLGLNLLTFSIAPALTAIGAAGYLRVLMPGLPAVPTAMVLVALCMGMSVLNVRLNAVITGLFLSLELVSLGVVAALGFAHPHRGLGAAILHPVWLDAGALKPVSWGPLGLGAAAAIYAFDGYGSAVYLGEEMQDAPRRMAPVVFWALALAALFQLPPILAILIGAPALRPLMADPSPAAWFIGAVGGADLAKAMSLAVALALFNAMIATALMGGRQLYSSGRDHAWPALASRALGRLHPRFNSPWVATLALGAMGLLWCLVKLQTLVLLIGDGTAAIYGCMCIAALKGRAGAAAHGPYRMPLYPLLPWLALATLGAVALADLLDAEGRDGLLVSAIVAALFAGYHRFVLRPRGTWAHRGPGV